MDKQAFKQRMQALKSYRENNPGKGYWDWRAQAFIDGGTSEYTDDRTDHPIQQKVELDHYLNLADYIDKVNHTDGEGYYNPFYNKTDDSYGTVPLDQVTVTAPLTQKAKNNIDARRGAKYVQEGMHGGKFNALKKRTGKTTEELTHSKNPLTRKRAIFAQNFSRIAKRRRKKK